MRSQPLDAPGAVIPEMGISDPDAACLDDQLADLGPYAASYLEISTDTGGRIMMRIRTPQLLAFVLVLGALSASLVNAQGSPKKPKHRAPAPMTLRVDPLLIAQAAEVLALISSPHNPVWPGWNASGTPLLFYLPGEQDVLINHPHPPDGFLPYTGPIRFPHGRIFVKNGPTIFEADGQNTSKEVGGVQTLVVADTLSNLRNRLRTLLEDPRPTAQKVEALSFSDLATDPYDQLGTVVHEGFHVFQHAQAPTKGANEMLLVQYPVLSVENNVGLAQEGSALAEALHATDRAAVRRAAVRWLEVRKDRRAGLPAKAVEYEDGCEFKEGLAKYTQYRLLQVLEGRPPGATMWWTEGFAGYHDLAPRREQLIASMVQHMGGEIVVTTILTELPRRACDFTTPGWRSPPCWIRCCRIGNPGSSRPAIL